MRRIIGTIGATLAAVAALAATTAAAQVDGNLNPGTPQVVGSAYESSFDRDSPGDETQDSDGGMLGADWEDDWFEDYEEGDGDWFEGREEASTALMLANLQFVPWAQAHDKFLP